MQKVNKENWFFKLIYGCDHEVVSGFGGMGDALVCVHCGFSKYPEVWTTSIPLMKLRGRYHTDTKNWKQIMSNEDEYKCIGLERNKQNEKNE